MKKRTLKRLPEMFPEISIAMVTPTPNARFTEIKPLTVPLLRIICAIAAFPKVF